MRLKRIVGRYWMNAIVSAVVSSFVFVWWAIWSTVDDRAVSYVQSAVGRYTDEHPQSTSSRSGLYAEARCPSGDRAIAGSCYIQKTDASASGLFLRETIVTRTDDAIYAERFGSVGGGAPVDVVICGWAYLPSKSEGVSATARQLLRAEATCLAPRRQREAR